MSFFFTFEGVRAESKHVCDSAGRSGCKWTSSMIAYQCDICTENLNRALFGLKYCPTPTLLNLYHFILLSFILISMVLTMSRCIWSSDTDQKLLLVSRRQKNPSSWFRCKPYHATCLQQQKMALLILFISADAVQHQSVYNALTAAGEQNKQSWSCSVSKGSLSL